MSKSENNEVKSFTIPVSKMIQLCRVFKKGREKIDKRTFLLAFQNQKKHKCSSLQFSEAPGEPRISVGYSLYKKQGGTS